MGLALIYRLQVVEGWIENHGFDRILWAYPDPLFMVFEPIHTYLERSSLKIELLDQHGSTLCLER